jgi:hypothetical protein
LGAALTNVLVQVRLMWLMVAASCVCMCRVMPCP